MEDNEFLAIAATSSTEHALEIERNSPVLPTQIEDGGKEALEKAGVKFLGLLEDDELFQRVELPNGWTKQPTDHALHAHLVDDKGRERGHIWYKPASYDRKAGLNVYTRFEYECD